MTDSTQHKPDLESTMIEVSDGIFAWIQQDGTWWINNAGFISSGDEVMVVDTCTTEARTRRFFDEIALRRPEGAMRYAINTHHHGDHTYGNCLLPRQTALIGHENMRSGLLADTTLNAFPGFWAPRPEFGSLSLRVPDITFSSSMTVYVGDRRVDLLHPGFTAHTDGDVVVWVPEDRVLFTGDLLFPGHTPMVMAGEPSGAIRSLHWMAELDPLVVVPGHGEVLDQAGFAATVAEHEAYYRFVLEEGRRGIADGLTPLEVARSTDLSSWEHLLDPERFVLNVHSAYGELRGDTVVRADALADAVTWLGHPIVTHV